MARATGRSGYRLSELPSGGLSGWFVQSKLPGRKFQSHPGVPPARLIEPPARYPPLSDATKSLQSRGDRDHAPTQMAIHIFKEKHPQWSTPHGNHNIKRHPHCAGRRQLEDRRAG